MTIQEITPKTLRALLLLLVLVPFIPMVLMVRFMADALDGSRDAAIERENTGYHQTLVNASFSLDKHLIAVHAQPTPEDARRFYRSIFPSEIEVVISDSSGKALAGQRPQGARKVAQTSLNRPETPWQPELYLTKSSPVDLAIRDQFRVYAWTAAVAAVAICAIAASAGVTLSNQLTLSELKNTSTATVAHELRTPLASMRILVDTLREGRCRTEQQRQEYLDLIAAENLRLSRLTDQFLTHSRLDRNQHLFQFTEMEPRIAIVTAIAALRDKLEAPGCFFTLKAGESLPKIVADQSAIVTVLTNLLENALKYTGDEKQITLLAEASADSLLFSLIDNGVGISRSDRKRIFEPYFQVDQRLSRAREGCGLGLSIVHRIVSAHHGNISVTSELGGGSRFCVAIPLKSPAQS